MADPSPGVADTEILAAERKAVLREAVRQLSPGCQGLIGLLFAEPRSRALKPSGKLDIPIGSTGPTRARCLERLRRHPAMATLISAGALTVEVN